MQSKALGKGSSYNHLLTPNTGHEKILRQYAVLPVSTS